ncbi:MAG: hypothetical protein ABIG10_00690 [bacterium]
MFVRSKNNPIIKPNKKHSWESRKTYNPGVVYHNKKYYVFYRAVGQNWKSFIGLAVSSDGEKFKRSDKPVFYPRAEFESRGVEDPRITKIKDKFLITYTAYDGKSARLKSAVSTDLKKWKKLGLMLPQWDIEKANGFLVNWDKAQQTKTAKKKWHKAGGIFPEKINKKYWMMFGDSNLWLAQSKDGIKWTPIWKPFIRPRKGRHFDNIHVEMGPPPIRTKKGWFVLYHGINEKIEYKLGYLLLDIHDPTKIIYRSKKPIFEPKEPYEISGLVDILPGGFNAMKKLNKKELDEFIKKNEQIGRMPKVTFCNGATLVNNKLEIFYGASDSVICKAWTNFSHLFI